MARFASAIMNGALDARFQRVYNDLLALLDSGYMTESTINGKKIRISIDPRQVITITVDGVKVFGVDSSGAVFTTKISSSQNPSTAYATMGDTGVPGGVSFELRDTSFQDDPVFRIAESINVGTGALAGWVMQDANGVTRIGISNAGDITFYDQNGKIRVSSTVAGNFYVRDANETIRLWITAAGDFNVYDESGESRFYSLTDGSFHVRNSGSTESIVNVTTALAELRTPTATDNRVGVDETGPYIITGGTKQYFSSAFATAPVSASFTPSIKFSGNAVGVTYTTQEGYYYKIGKLCFIHVSIVLSSKGTSVGNLEIAGLPFNNARSPEVIPCCIQNITYPASALELITRFNGASRTYVNMFGQLSGSTLSIVTNAQVADNSVILLSGAYETT